MGVLGMISFILGILGMFLSFIMVGSFLCLLSIILGAISLSSGSGEKWPAICGIVCSGVGVFIVLAIFGNFVYKNPDMLSRNREPQSAGVVNNQNNMDNQSNSGGSFGVEKNIFSVELTIPEEFAEKHTQNEWDKISDENGYKSIKLNSDGSVTYKMTNSQHQEIVEATRQAVNAGLDEMVGSTDYPNFTDIKSNSNFTEFTVTTKSDELSFGESFATLALYVYGGMFNAFSGDSVDNISVTFVNANTGNVISQANSRDMAKEDAENSSQINNAQQESNSNSDKDTFGIGETWAVDGQWKLTINSVQETADRNPYSEKNPGAVYIVTYTYENVGYEDGLFFSLTNGSIIDSGRKMGYSYPGDVTKYAQETPIGAYCEAEECIGVDNPGNFQIIITKYDEDWNEHKATFDLKF